MVARRTERGARRYACRPREMGGCNGCGIDAAQLEDLVTEMVMYRLDTPDLAEALRRDRDEADDDVVEAMDADEAALEQLARDHYADRLIGRREFLAARAEIERRIEANRSRLARQRRGSLLEGLAGEGGVLRTAWPAMNLERRRAVIGAILERVEIAPGTRRMNRFSPERVNPIWRV
jgi:site-specific DNA recombinase